MWRLKDWSLFDCMEGEDLQRLAQSVRLDVVLRKSYLDIDGSEDAVYFVKQGFLKVLRLLPSGEEVVIDIIGPGEFFGHVHGRQMDVDHEADVVESLDDAIVCVIPRTNFERVIESSAELQREILAHFNDRIERITERLVDLAFRTSQQRLAAFLLRFVQTYGTTTSQGAVVESRISQQEIGYLTGMSRQTVTTLMTSWKASGIMSFDRRSIIVHDLNALERIVQGNEAIRQTGT
jgi:CRP-like cAMP-binding protein